MPSAALAAPPSAPTPTPSALHRMAAAPPSASPRKPAPLAQSPSSKSSLSSSASPSSPRGSSSAAPQPSQPSLSRKQEKSAPVMKDKKMASRSMASRTALAGPPSLRRKRSAVSEEDDPKFASFNRFLDLQKGSGAFTLDAKFSEATSLNQESIKKALPKELADAQGIDDSLKLTVWVTAIALAYLQSKFSDKKELWTLIKDKIMKFISRSVKPANIDPALIHNAAKAFLK